MPAQLPGLQNAEEESNLCSRGCSAAHPPLQSWQKYIFFLLNWILVRKLWLFWNPLTPEAPLHLWHFISLGLIGACLFIGLLSKWLTLDTPSRSTCVLFIIVCRLGGSVSILLPVLTQNKMNNTWIPFSFCGFSFTSTHHIVMTYWVVFVCINDSSVALKQLRAPDFTKGQILHNVALKMILKKYTNNNNVFTIQHLLSHFHFFLF